MFSESSFGMLNILKCVIECSHFLNVQLEHSKMCFGMFNLNLKLRKNILKCSLNLLLECSNILNVLTQLKLNISDSKQIQNVLLE